MIHKLGNRKEEGYQEGRKAGRSVPGRYGKNVDKDIKGCQGIYRN